VPGIVLWGPSNPKIFGYHYNINILKSDKFFRKLQYDEWKPEDKNIDAFETADKVFLKIQEVLKPPVEISPNT
jgi:hypothetical protein